MFPFINRGKPFLLFVNELVWRIILCTKMEVSENNDPIIDCTES